jgi:hypothetical protein
VDSGEQEKTMVKRWMASAAMLVIAVFAAAPAAAQAQPHWFNHNNLVGPEPGITKPFGGSIVYTLQAVTVTCHLGGRMSIWNPVGGGAGEDEITAAKISHCSRPAACPETTTKVTTLGLPWHSQLIAGVPIRDEIKGIDLEFRVCGQPWVCKGTLTPAVGKNSLNYEEEELCPGGRLGGETRWHCNITAMEQTAKEQ